MINTGIGFATELRARRAIEALLQLDVPQAAVLRDGMRASSRRRARARRHHRAEAGSQVPADARLIESADVHVNEAPLTGESLPYRSSPTELAADTPLAERTTWCSRARPSPRGLAARVVATGGGTEVGRIGELTSIVEYERTPLERRLDALGRRLVWLALGIAALVAGLVACRARRSDMVLETGIALAVAAVPEALPAVATIALAVGMHRMAARHALVRCLPAVESLGSTTVVCTDKTRTLTSGDMTIVRMWAAGDVSMLIFTGQAHGTVPHAR